MIKKRYFLTITSFFLFILGLQLDPFVKSFVREENITAIAKFFSATGNGGFQALLCFVIYGLGYYFSNNQKDVETDNFLSNRGIAGIFDYHLSPDFWERLKEAGQKGFLVILTSGVLVQVLKSVFERPRIGYRDGALLSLLENSQIFDLSSRFGSFPSGHTTTSFALAYTFSVFFPGLRFLFYPVAVLIGLSRIYLGSHYPSDVVAGAVFGFSVAFFLRHYIKDYWKEACLLILTLFFSFFKLGSFLLFDVDEAVFSEATREMIETGDYISPTYNFEPRYDKPILFYWLMAASFKLFGVTEFAARFPSAFLGVGLVAISFFFVRQLKGLRAAILTSLCLLLNIHFLVYSHSAVTDMTLTFFITASLYCFYLGLFKYPIPNFINYFSWYQLFWIFAALATLTKGVIGLLFPFSIIFLYLLATKNLRELRDLINPRLLFIFLVVASPWYLAQFYINGWDFFNAFILKHHFQRFTGIISSHRGPIFYYLPVILIGFLPWVIFLPRGFYKCFKEKGIYLFGLIWFLFIFIFFSISKTKLPNYVFPLFPAMALMVGSLLDSSLKEGKKMVEFYALALLSGIISLTLLALPFVLKPDQIFELVALQGRIFSLGIIFLLFTIAALIIKGRVFAGFIVNSVAISILLIFLRVYGIPPVNIYLQKTLYEYSIYSRQTLNEDGILATYEINQPSIAFYSRRKIIKLEGNDIGRLTELITNNTLLLITKKDNIEALTKKANLITLDFDKEYALLTNRENLTLPR